MLVDTLGLILLVVVHAANIQDRDGAKLVLQQILGCFPRLTKIWVDGGYAGQLIEWAAQLGGWILEVVNKLGGTVGFVVLPKRWIVERTFAWLGKYRRLSKDYEQDPQSSESMVYLAMINLMVHRLRPG